MPKSASLMLKNMPINLKFSSSVILLMSARFMIGETADSFLLTQLLPSCQMIDCEAAHPIIRHLNQKLCYWILGPKSCPLLLLLRFYTEQPEPRNLRTRTVGIWKDILSVALHSTIPLGFHCEVSNYAV